MDADNTRSTPRHFTTLAPRRRKTRLACNLCRETKSRCDGRQPSCSRCVSKGVNQHCVYEKETLKTRRYVALLEKRVRELETEGPRGSSQDGRSPHDVEIEGSQTCSYSPGPLSQQHPRTKTTHHTSGTFAGSSNDPIDRLDALVMVPSPSTTVYHHGGSSVTSFLRSIAHRVGMNEMADQRLPQIDRTNNSMTKENDSAEHDPRAFSMPARGVADGMMHHFWSYIHPIFSILHKPTFSSIYESLWIPEANILLINENPVILAILNIIFALHCQSRAREDAADHFYEKSRELCSADAVDLPSLETVQLLLLTGIYLQSTKYASRCWTTVGLAIRYAQYLGLHLDCSRQMARSQVEQEIRRRVWHSCVMMDRLLSLSFNRPSMTPMQCHVPLPLMVDDENLDSRGNHPEYDHVHPKSQMAFFVYSIKLFEILNNTLLSLYPSSSEHFYVHDLGHWWSREHLDRLSPLNRALDDLSLELPAHLRPYCNVGPNCNILGSQLAWQGYVFRCRFLYVKALMLRPVLLSAAVARMKQKDFEPRPETPETLEEISAIQICSLCVETVHDLVQHMSDSVGIVSKYASWREVHYTFICAIVVLAARLCSFKSKPFHRSALDSSWGRCWTILEHFKPRIQSVKTAMEILHSLELRVSEMEATEVPLCPLQEIITSAGNLSQSPRPASLFEDPFTLADFDFNVFDDLWPREQVGNLGWLA